jgi:hypothetical protein
MSRQCTRHAAWAVARSYTHCVSRPAARVRVRYFVQAASRWFAREVGRYPVWSATPTVTDSVARHLSHADVRQRVGALTQQLMEAIAQRVVQDDARYCTEYFAV